MASSKLFVIMIFSFMALFIVSHAKSFSPGRKLFQYAPTPEFPPSYEPSSPELPPAYSPTPSYNPTPELSPSYTPTPELPPSYNPTPKIRPPYVYVSAPAPAPY
ncbi:hypothetical protein CARUB_v10022477mg [Capsella rubella]|uniref:Extensin domain-containing protein n=1 Tax=Capsella rubella TaxID=81985 RepID=R0HYC5_9BRAS|nr:extensin-2 [Capsella rubella]EOA34894.1 hypothetical protein CARUB_v10022477mg [Capsella rubella]